MIKATEHGLFITQDRERQWEEEGEKEKQQTIEKHAEYSVDLLD